MAGRQTVFNAIGATTTTELHSFKGLEPSAAAGALLLEVLGGTSANFTLDVQGKVHEDGTYTNIDYIQLYQAGSSALANSQLTVNDQTVRFYLIPIPPPLVQLVATFTAGSLTIHASFIHLSFNPTPLGGVAIEVDSSDPGSVAAAAAVFARTDLNRRLLVSPVHPNYFNTKTAITTADTDTAVVPAGGAGLRTFITDIIIATNQNAAIGSFTLTNDAGTTILGPIEVKDQEPFIAHFNTPLVNETANDQVEMDKTAAEDDWQVYIAGYYAP